jgi:ribosome-associated toxin RatA of RatAB toxin-antitoxin module
MARLKPRTVDWNMGCKLGALVRALSLLLFGAVGAAIGQERDGRIVFDVRQDGGRALIEARAEIAAPAELVWHTITDYDRLAEFVPGLISSRVVGRDGNTVTVEQMGELRIFFLRFPIDVTLASIESPPFEIGVKVLRGNLRRLDGGYRIEERGANDTLLHWRGLIEPDWIMPPFIGAALLREPMRRQFAGMVQEIGRREDRRRATIDQRR